MPRILHSINTQDQAIAADGIYNYDLAVNPLSTVLLVARPLNDTGTLANFQSYLGIAAAFNRITIQRVGEAVFSMRGEDAAALNYFRHGIMPYQAYHLDTDNDRRAVVIPLILGRQPYDSKSCMPASRRGELNLELDIDIADTGYDGMRLSIETIEIVDAKPTEYERKTSVNQTFAATGDNDVDLTPGAINRGVLCWGTTAPTGAAPAPTLGRLKVMVDNSDTFFNATDVEVASSLCTLWGRQPPAYDAHIHRQTANTDTVTNGGPISVGYNGWQNYAFLDFDPTRDDEFVLDCREAKRFNLRVNAEAANAARFVQIEKLKA